MRLILKIYNSENANQHILKQVENIGKKEEMLPIYYDNSSLLNELTTNNSYLMTIQDENNKVLAFIVYTINDINPKSIHIKSICTDSHFKRYKLGTNIIENLKKIYDTITLYVQLVNETAFKFYIKNGFKTKKKIDNYYSSLKNKEAFFMAFN